MLRHFVSYPKSGRTWIRYIFAQLGVEQLVTFHHDGFEFNDGAKPPHDFDLTGRLARYSHVDRLVFLDRDPRDVMVSLYSQITGRFRDLFAYNGNPSDFLRDDYFGATNLKRFREMWKQITGSHGFLVVSYEACHTDTEQTVHKILDYYDLAVAPQRVSYAVRNATFQRMREVEQASMFPHAWLRPRNGSLKVRRGRVGGFRDALCAEDVAYLNGVFNLEP